MLLRLPVVAALGVALVLAPSASAAEVIPAPTAAVSVTYAGQPGPKSLTTATWLENKRGTNAQLSIDATNLPGMRSTVDAVWTTQLQLRIHVALADLGREHQVWKTFAAV